MKNWILKVSSFLLKPISMQHIIRKITKLAVSYNDDATCNRIADISVFTYGMKEVFPCEGFCRSPQNLNLKGKHIVCRKIISMFFQICMAII